MSHSTYRHPVSVATRPGVMEEPQKSGRGFRFFEPIPSKPYPGEVQLLESSLALLPAVWLKATDESGEATASLDLDGCRQLAEQLNWFMENHYQVQGKNED